MIKSRHNQTCWGNLRLWQSVVGWGGSNSRWFEGSLFDTRILGPLQTWVLTVLILELCRLDFWDCFQTSILRAHQSSFGYVWSCHEKWTDIALKPLKDPKEEAVEAPRWTVATSSCTTKMVLTKLLTYYAFRVQKKSFMSTGMIGKASSPESPWSTWTWSHQFGRHKTSGLEWKSHSEWWHTPRHAACGQATDGRRGQDAPVLPMRGRLSRLRHVWASNQWKNSIGSMDCGSGSKRFSSTKNSWRARLFKSKRYRFWDYRFLKKWYCIFCRFLNWRSHRHDSVSHQSLCFCCAKAAVNCVLREFAELGFLDLHRSGNL